LQEVFPIDIEQARFLELDVIPNKNKSRVSIQCIHPEFTAVCPKTGYPDFARVILQYVPNELKVELKSWKEYLACYYGVGCYHEECNENIIEHFTEFVDPRWVRITMDWHSRGGVKTVTSIMWSGASRGYMSYPDDWKDDIFLRSIREWRNS
jgi:7-cyano-7-deazaguanine reductase